ncbi:hypothetical protein AC1031_019516 [Aphanomyces cochlioides]|nr:hypothetical protein AC1031_019516 [Aphanomyces cochlioides]
MKEASSSDESKQAREEKTTTVQLNGKKRAFAKREKNERTDRPRGTAESLEAGFLAIKEGLISLGQSQASNNVHELAPHQPRATLDDVLQAIQAQSNTMAQLISHLTKKDE